MSTSRIVGLELSPGKRLDVILFRNQDLSRALDLQTLRLDGTKLGNDGEGNQLVGERPGSLNCVKTGYYDGLIDEEVMDVHG